MPRPSRSRSSPTTATTPRESLGIHGINVNDITTGLPNINITNFTGISGGPAFLPVNPSQFHYQIEDALVWLKGRHQLKFGYRLVDRRPSPLIHDRHAEHDQLRHELRQQPADEFAAAPASPRCSSATSTTRAGGSCSRSVHFRVVEQAAFVQDDFKVNNRLTVNAGLRYEIFTPPTEEDNRLANFDYETFRLVYAGENGTSRSANKKTHYINFAPRLGLTYGLTGDARTVLRTGFGITYFPSPHAAGNLNHLNVPFAISQNVQHETNPLDFTPLRTIADPFPPIVPVKPQTTAELIAANPRVLGHSFENETPYAEQWHLGIERQLFSAMLRGGGVRRQRRQAPHALLQPERGAAGTRVAGFAPAAAADRLGQQHAAVRSAQPFDLPRRHAARCSSGSRNGPQFLVSYTYGKSLDYGGSAASGGGAVGNGQTITNMDAWHGPSGFDVRHRTSISYVYELPFGTGRRWMSNAGSCSGASSAAGSWRASRP